MIQVSAMKHQTHFATLVSPEDGQTIQKGHACNGVNIVEHPEVVAQRIAQAAEAVGDRSRVIAAADCGFGTFTGSELVAESVIWAKVRTLRQGADLASARLWG